MGSHAGPLPGSPLSTDSTSAGPISKAGGQGGDKAGRKKRSSAPVVVLLLILIIAGAGVGGEFTGNGWFFMNLLLNLRNRSLRGDAPTADTPPPKAKQAGTAGQGQAAPPAVAGLADVPAAYRAKIAELENQLKSAKDDAAKTDITDKLVVLHTKFLYRWPARMHHDESMQARLKSLKEGRKSQSFHAQFWEVFQGALDEPDDAKRKAGLKKAEVALAKVNFAVLLQILTRCTRRYFSRLVNRKPTHWRWLSLR